MSGAPDSAAAPDASVVIVNYDGARLLTSCLRAVARQAAASYEIIVVDNGSSDGSRELVRREFPDVSLVALERNTGFAAGNNVGCARARGRFLAFLNNDAEPDADWLARSITALNADPGAALATARVVYAHDPAILDSAGDGWTMWGGGFKRGHGQPVESAREAREVFAACGAACVIRRDVFERIGGFDEDFFLSHEDIDLSYRVQLLGYRCLYVADAVVRHAVSATLGRVSARAVFYGQRNLEWVYLKNTPGPLLVATLPGHLVYVAAGAVYYTAIGAGAVFCRAKWAALRGLPRIWRKRRVVQASRRTSIRRLYRLMERGWIVLKWREKRFDLKAARS